MVPAGDGELLHGPQLLPDGRTILFTVAPVMFLDPVVTARWDEAQVAAQRLGSADRTVILTGGTDARYVPTGHLVYAAGGTLLAAPFDVSRLVLGGPAVPVVEHLRPSNDGSSANYAFSDGGTFVAVRASDYTGRSELVWVERSTGREERLQAPPRAYSNPRVSPDGTRIAVTMRDGEQDIHVLDIGQGVLRPLTANATPDYQPEWVDDRRLVLASVVDGSYQVFLQDADGLTPARQLTEGSVHTFPTSVSRNGRTVLVEGAGPPCCDLGVLTIDPLAPVQWIANTPELERTPVLSPNGEWLAYQANRRGRGEVYVRRFPVEGSDVPLTTDGGSNPVWARDGSELYYWTVQDGTVTIMAVRATSGPPSAWGRAEPVISGPFIESQGDTQYDVAPDGRFLVLKKASGSRPADGILIIQNWTEELTRLVPVDGDRSGA